ncbi:glycosyltransferase family 25 protein [Durotheca rogersii]|uniref:glycosyltransferase family 25 protein n=1 Tax=Durotheca rogersii TaxID=419775 RepID=UPI00221EA63A|nr:glycosyltransferase family 25 protein [Durotheca rogersii]KAI5860642.1 glycosyltransferase family 25 protein [Durotheca rogersii]
MRCVPFEPSFAMLSRRRGVIAICIFALLLYVYWRRLAGPNTPEGLLSSATRDTFNDTLGFEKIFVINLLSRADRRHGMAQAGAASNLTFDWIDGIPGSQFLDDTSLAAGEGHSAGARGSYMSHMKALKAITRENLGSALIFEDDIDWDVRLKSQLDTFARASRTWLREANQERQQVELWKSAPSLFVGKRGSESASMREPEGDKMGVRPGVQSIYGDGWDVLWLGHCGADFPDEQSPASPLRIVVPKDETVPAPKHLKPHPFALRDKLGEIYPPHTRVVHAVDGNVCTLAYAVSHQGARKLLREFDAKFDSQWDLILQKWCDRGHASNTTLPIDPKPASSGESDQPRPEANPICLTVQPPLFSHRYVREGTSNIQGQGGGFARGVGTPYIRLSVHDNLEKLMKGVRETEMIDQLADDGVAIW